MTASDLILKRLEQAGRPLAVHELGIYGVSDNAAATRLSELAGEGKVAGTYRAGKWNSESNARKIEEVLGRVLK